MQTPDLSGKVAIVTGSSRGIGKQVALKLATAGCDICVAAKSIQPKANLPGTILQTRDEILAIGRRSIAVQTNLRDVEQIERMVEQTVQELGGVDILINNAGALWWKDLLDTPPNRFDLVVDVNARASFAACYYALPHMIARGGGHIIMMSPPIDPTMIRGKVAYCISKFGMTLIAHGLADEVKHHGIAVNSLWPATLVESLATRNFGLGSPQVWRKADILADATLAIVGHDPTELTGQALIDEEILQRVGVTDFSVYNCTADGQPLRIIGERKDAERFHNTGGPTSS